MKLESETKLRSQAEILSSAREKQRIEGVRKLDIREKFLEIERTLRLKAER